MQDRPIPWVFGTHIEMTNTPFQDYPFGATVHVDEHPLELRRDHVIQLLQAVLDMQADPQVTPYPEFIVFPL
jgi:hypothetical protein